MQETKRLIIRPPKADEPGYLRFLRRMGEFARAMRKAEEDFGPEIADAIVEFLLGLVVEPKDKDEAREILWDLSRKEFEEIMQGLMEAMKPEVPPKSAAP